MLQEPNEIALFPQLSDEVLQHLQGYGTEIDLNVGEYLFKEGEHSYDFHVVLDGEIQVTKQVGEKKSYSPSINEVSLLVNFLY